MGREVGLGRARRGLGLMRIPGLAAFDAGEFRPESMTGGYGTLQEFMIVDEYFDEIEPDLIVWPEAAIPTAVTSSPTGC